LQIILNELEVELIQIGWYCKRITQIGLHLLQWITLLRIIVTHHFWSVLEVILRHYMMLRK